MLQCIICLTSLPFKLLHIHCFGVRNVRSNYFSCIFYQTNSLPGKEMAVSAIIPRYEFRAFAQNFGIVETKMRQLSKCEMIRESSEIYIVSATNLFK